MKRAIALLLGLIMVFSLVACGQSPSGQEGTDSETPPGSSDPVQTPQEPEKPEEPEGKEDAATKPVELSLFHFYTKEDAETNLTAAVFQESLKRFQAANPDIRLNISEMAHDDFQIKIQALALADDLPDMYMLLGSRLENYVENGLILDTTDYVDSLPWRDDYYEGIFKSITYKGRIYGAPVNFLETSSIVYYNEDLWKSAGFDTFPQTWEEIEAAAEQFNARGITTIALGNKDRWPYGSCWFSTLANRFTGVEWLDRIMARDGSAKFTDPEFVDALKFTAKLGQSRILNPDYNSISNQQADDLYCQGKAATLVEGHWSIDYIIQNASEEIVDATRLTVLPQPPGAVKGKTNSISCASGWFLSLSSKLEGEKKDKALYTVFNLLGPEFSRIFSEMGGKGPIRVEDVDISSFPKLRQIYLTFVDTYSACDIYDVVLNSSLIDVMNVGFQEVMAGTKTPEALAQEIQAVQEELEKE